MGVAPTNIQINVLGKFLRFPSIYGVEAVASEPLIISNMSMKIHSFEEWFSKAHIRGLERCTQLGTLCYLPPEVRQQL